MGGWRGRGGWLRLPARTGAPFWPSSSARTDFLVPPTSQSTLRGGTGATKASAACGHSGGPGGHWAVQPDGDRVRTEGRNAGSCVREPQPGAEQLLRDFDLYRKAGSEVQVFREWILQMAANERLAIAAGVLTTGRNQASWAGRRYVGFAVAMKTARLHGCPGWRRRGSPRRPFLRLSLGRSGSRPALGLGDSRGLTPHAIIPDSNHPFTTTPGLRMPAMPTLGRDVALGGMRRTSGQPTRLTGVVSALLAAVAVAK